MIAVQIQNSQIKIKTDDNTDFKTRISSVQDYIANNIRHYESSDGCLLEYLKRKDDISKYHIVDCQSGWYNIYFNRYDGYYDLFLNGNLGRHTAIDIIKETARSEPDACFIIWTGDGDTSVQGIEFQFPCDAAEYIKDHFVKTDSIYDTKNNEVYAVYKEN